jgi:D-tyrosyl-tRNA(Tyr) deacylase
MRVVVQRVRDAEVRVGGARVGGVGRGLLLLVGITHSDGERDLQVMADKVAGLRIFTDAEGKMNLDLTAVGGSILAVSQFTLYGDVRRGRRPSFVGAAHPEMAEPAFDRFCERLRAAGLTVETGRFGAMMEVDFVNDGPVTLVLETRDGVLQPGLAEPGAG